MPRRASDRETCLTGPPSASRAAPVLLGEHAEKGSEPRAFLTGGRLFAFCNFHLPDRLAGYFRWNVRNFSSCDQPLTSTRPLFVST